MSDSPTPPYTEATVEFAATKIRMLCGDGKEEGGAELAARVVLSGLARRGLLRPEGAETRTGAKPSASSDQVARLVTDHAISCVCLRCDDIRAGFDIGVASGRAQAAADIRAYQGSLDGSAWQERAAEIAEGGGVADQSKDLQ